MAQSMFDPEENELGDLDALYKSILARKVRGGSNWGDPLMAVTDSISNSMDRREVEARKMQLVARQQQQLEAAMPDASPEVRALMSSPHTRPAALAKYGEERKRMEAERQYAEFTRGRPAAPGAGPSPEGQSTLPQTMSVAQRMSSLPDEELLAMQQHPNASMATTAKAIMAYREKGRDPNHLYPQAGSSSPSLMPNALAALEGSAGQTARGKAQGELEWINDPTDPTKQRPVPRASLLGPGQGPVGGSVPPGPSAAPNNLPGPQNVVGGGPTPPATRPAPQGGSPVDQMTAGMKRSLVDAASKGDMQTVNQIGNALINRGVPQQEVVQLVANSATVQQPPQGQPPQGQPQQPMPQQPMPQQPMPQQPMPSAGASRPSPQGTAISQHIGAEYPKMEASYYSAKEILDKLPTIEKSIKDNPGWAYGALPRFVGGPLLRTMSAAGAYSEKEMAAHQTLGAAEAALMGPMAKEANLGTSQGFTDKDREFVSQRLPSPNKSERENRQAIQEIKDYFQRKSMESFARLKQANPEWTPVGQNPTEPGQTSAPVPGKQSAAEPNDSYWGMSASSGQLMSDAYGPEGKATASPTRPIDQGNVLERTLKGLEHGIGVAGAGVTSALPSSVAKMVGLQQPTEQDVGAIREAAPQTTAGGVGQFVGETAANPTSYVPMGGPLSTLKALGAGAASGATALAATPEERARNTIFSSTLGALGNKVANKFIPATETSTPAQAAAREGFESVPLSQKQIAGKNRTWEAEGISEQQARAITAKLMKGTGSESSRATSAAIDAQESMLKGEFNKMFPSDRAIRMETSDAAKIQAVMDPYKEVMASSAFVERAPGIRQLYDFSRRTVERNKPRVIPADILQGALQDVSHIENPRMQKAMRDEIKAYVERSLGPKEAEEFAALNQKWGALQDVRKMGYSDGMIQPSSVRGPSGSEASAAKDFVENFNIKNPKPFWDQSVNINPNVHTPTGALGAALSIAAGSPVSKSSGWAQGKLGMSNLLDWNPTTKELVELLRKQSSIAPREFSEYRRDDNAPR